MSKIDYFSEVKNEGVKTDISDKKAYLITISFAKMSVFAVFHEKVVFLVVFWTPLKSGVFYCFRHVRFPNGFLGKTVKTAEIHEKHQKRQNQPKCHRQT